MLGFLFSQFSPIEIIVFNKNFLYPIEDINFLSSNVKDILPPIIFCKILRFKNCQIGHVLEEIMRALKNLVILLRA